MEANQPQRYVDARFSHAPGVSTDTIYQLDANALIAQKRAEIAAKIAAMKKGPASGGAAPSPLAATASTARPSATATVSAGPTAPTPSIDDLARRVAEAQRRVSEAQRNVSIKDNPYMVRLLRMSQYL